MASEGQGRSSPTFTTASAVLAIHRAAWVHETQDLPPEAEAALWRLLVCARGPYFEIPADERAQAQVAKVDLRSWRRVVRPALRRFLIAGPPPRVHALPFLAGYVARTDVLDLREDELHACCASDRGSLDESCECQAPQTVRTNTAPQPGPASPAPAGERGPAMSYPQPHPHPPVYSPLALSVPQRSDDAASRFAGLTSDQFFDWLYANHPRPRYRRKAHRRWRFLQIPDGDTATYEQIAAELERWITVEWVHCEPQHVKDLWGWLEERVWEDHLEGVLS